jgi:hypothetical protein
MLAKAKLASSITFIVLASFTIVTYDRQNMFIIQATKDIKFDYLSLHVEKVFFSGCNFCQSKNCVQIELKASYKKTMAL